MESRLPHGHATTGQGSGTPPAGAAPRADGHWVGGWVAMPQRAEPYNMPPEPFAGGDGLPSGWTLRQTIRTTLGGGPVRLRFSNAFGDTALPITRVALALPAAGRAGARAIEPGTSRAVTFLGRSSAVVPAGAQVVSDPLDVEITAGTDLTVTVHLGEGLRSAAVTAHPGSRTTSHLLAGDHADAVDLPGATPVEHWYLLSGLEVWSAPGTAAVVIVGDSLTDGRGSTTDGNDRWPDRLADRLRAAPSGDAVAVLNQAAGGNRILNDGLGPAALARFDRDVLAQSGVKWLIVFEGVNDIGTADATETAQKQITDDLIAAYHQLIVRAHAHGIRVYGATLTPFGGHDYDDPHGHRETSRRTINEWIRTSARFDAVLDFDQAVRDPSSPRRLLPVYDVGDHLHMNPAAYQTLADTVPVDLFHPAPPPATSPYE